MHAICNNHFCSGRCRTKWWNVKRTKDGTFARHQKKKRSEQKGVLDLNCLAQLESIKKILDHGWDPDENKNDKKITSHFQNRALEFRRVLIRLREGGFNLIKDFDPKFKELIASYKAN